MEPKSLREVRRGRLFSIQELATKAGVSTKTVLDLEHGRTVPHLRTVRKISGALDVDAMEIAEFVSAIEAGGQGKELAA